MRKILFMIAAVCTLFTACNNEPEHIYDDHSADLVGTWTCVQEGFAEALVISADGSIVATGLGGEKYWENVKGNFTVTDGNAILAFEDNVTFEGHLDIIPGVAFSINPENGERVTFNYCKEDLADEIIGMWVCTQIQSGMPTDMFVQTFKEDGKSIYTGYETITDSILLNKETPYKVIGDLCFLQTGNENKVMRLTYSPKGTTLGDLMIFNNSDIKNATWLRIRQSLDLANKNYDYSNIYVTNVKGEDKAFEFAGQTLNFATLDGKIMDKLMRHILFNVSFDAEKIYYNCYFNGENKSIDAPIVVDGNKVTIKMSENSSVYRDIEVYMFQDQGNTQMHMYMPATSFEKFFGNVSVAALAKEGKLDLSDAEAVAQIYASIEEAIETINVSFIFKDSTRAL